MTLRDAHPWIWENNCWHPHRTPLSQKGIAPNLPSFRDAFDAKLKVMKDHWERSKPKRRSAVAVPTWKPHAEEK